MKKQLLYCVAFIFAGVFTSCNIDDGPTSINPDRIARFETAEEVVEVPEDSEEVYELGVEINYDSDTPVMVQYEVEGDASLIEFLTASGSAVIPAGERTGKILFTSNAGDDIPNGGNREVTIRVTGTDSNFEGPSDVAPGLIEKTIVFIDDDCEVNASMTYEAEVSALGGMAPSFTATLTPTGNENEFTIDSSWGPNFVAWATGDDDFAGQFPYAGTITLTPTSASLVGDASWATGGSGSYDSCNDVISLTLTQALFTTSFTVDVVLTGNGD